MCGIVGYVGEKDVSSVLLVGLEKLHYRGYDSAGIATLGENGLALRKKVGKLKVLAANLDEEPLDGLVGIGHTRWATHGEPTVENAHPHTDCTGTLALVHNGIIENYLELQRELEGEGHTFKSETDTEVLCHLIERELERGDGISLGEAVRRALLPVKGAYAIAVISERDPDCIVAARTESPLIIGLGKHENILASDIAAVLGITHDVVYLENGEIAVVTAKKVEIRNFQGEVVDKNAQALALNARQAEKGNYPHFMLKEMWEQPSIIAENLARRVNGINRVNILDEDGLTNKDLNRVSQIMIQAAGTSWHSGLIGKLLLEKYCHIHTEVDISSEFRYRNPIVDGDTLVMAISQSGETADTLAGIREAKAKFLKVLSICNVENSTVARESDAVIYIHAGPEIGVASTKAYTAQLLALYLFSMYLGRLKYILDEEDCDHLLSQLRTVPRKMDWILQHSDEVKAIAGQYSEAGDFFFLGRGYHYPSALEGALKLKEIAYIHATGHPAGELKHGPLALIDENVPTVAIVTNSPVYDKMLSNIREVKARRGKVIAIATEGDDRIQNYADCVLYVPEIDDVLSPLLVALQLQLLAYHIAVLRGCDVDQPRNLAKSVTVE